jgi:hypothetical protein
MLRGFLTALPVVAVIAACDLALLYGDCGLAPNEPADRTGVENTVRAQASAHEQVSAVNRAGEGLAWHKTSTPLKP